MIDTFLSVVVVGRQVSGLADEALKDLESALTKHFRHVEFVLVDDGSEDETFSIFRSFLARVPNSRAVRLSKFQGAEIAVVAGMDLAIGDYVLTMELGRDPVEAALNITQEMIRSGQAMIGRSSVYRTYPIFYRALRWQFFAVARKLGVDLPEGTTLLAALPRSAVTLLQRSKEKFRFLRLINQTIGVPYRLWDYQQNEKAPPKSLFAAVNLGINIVIHQGAALIHLALLLCLLAGLFTTVSGVVFYLRDEIGLFQMFSAFFMTVGFIVLFVVLEYLKAIFNQVRGVDLYYILEDKTSSVDPNLRNISRHENE